MSTKKAASGASGAGSTGRKRKAPEERSYAALLREQQYERANARKARGVTGKRAKKKQNGRTAASCIDLTQMRTPLPPASVTGLRTSKGHQSSVVWLSGKPASWKPESARVVVEERIAVRYRPAPYQHGTKPLRPSLMRDGLQVAALSDLNKWEPLYEVRPSEIEPDEKEGTDPGLGVFAARNFADGDIVTRWIGDMAPVNSRKANKWVGKRSKSWKEVYCITQRTGKKHLVFAPACDEKKDIYGDALFFCAHLINHSDDPNCQVDNKTMEVHALYAIAKREELTIKYNR